VVTVLELTDTTIRGAKPREKAYKLRDGQGLHLLIKANGSRLWRLRYEFEGVEKGISLGIYPDVSLKQARTRRDAARRLIAEGVDPSAKRKADKLAVAESFELVTREWLASLARPPVLPNNAKRRRRRHGPMDPKTIARMTKRFETFVFPNLGSRPMRRITAPELLGELRRIEARGTHETAHRVRAACSRVFRYAIATGRAERDVAADLVGALVPVESRNFAAVTEPKEVAGLLRAIDSYRGEVVTQFALKLLPLVFVRPGELRKAEWTQIDFKGALWRIPWSRMKMGEQHLIPLSTQASALLKDLQNITGGGRFLFPSLRGSDRPMSDNTVNAALRRLGYSSDEMTGHGFRTMASTLLNELGWNRGAIERQLAHDERDESRDSYNHARYLAERRKMMQAWADYLDTLRSALTLALVDNSRNLESTQPRAA
jgi:integrase